MTRLKELLKSLTPPIALKLFRRLRNRRGAFGWHGNYGTWNDALRDSGTYDDEVIFQRVLAANRAVQAGQAQDERDSSTFSEPQYSWPMLAVLGQVALKRPHPLHVLDFGGALGTSYHKARRFLGGVAGWRWDVIEQERLAEAGRREFSTPELNFYPALADIPAVEQADCLLLSGVLQCIEDPYALLKWATGAAIPYILIDRTPFIDGPARIVVQSVGAALYDASFPSWLFNEPEFLAALTGTYRQVASFGSVFDPPGFSEDRCRVVHKGFLFEHRSHAGSSTSP